jgi:hypothetical protein
MHPIHDLFLESFSYVLQFDMHFYIHSYVDKKNYSCKKWVLHVATLVTSRRGLERPLGQAPVSRRRGPVRGPPWTSAARGPRPVDRVQPFSIRKQFETNYSMSLCKKAPILIQY